MDQDTVACLQGGASRTAHEVDSIRGILDEAGPLRAMEGHERFQTDEAAFGRLLRSQVLDLGDARQEGNGRSGESGSVT